MEEEREVTARSFKSYGRPLEMVTSFKYLGRVISEADENWPVVVKNLSHARNVLRRMLCILSKEGSALRVSGISFKAMAQAVLLFGLDTWLVTPLMDKPWGGLFPGGNTADGMAPAEETGQELDIYIGSDGKGEGRVLGDGGIHQEAPEHGCIVHCYAITVRYL